MVINKMNDLFCRCLRLCYVQASEVSNNVLTSNNTKIHYTYVLFCQYSPDFSAASKGITIIFWNERQKYCFIDIFGIKTTHFGFVWFDFCNLKLLLLCVLNFSIPFFRIGFLKRISQGILWINHSCWIRKVLLIILIVAIIRLISIEQIKKLFREYWSPGRIKLCTFMFIHILEKPAKNLRPRDPNN